MMNPLPPSPAESPDFVFEREGESYLPDDRDPRVLAKSPLCSADLPTPEPEDGNRYDALMRAASGDNATDAGGRGELAQPPPVSAMRGEPMHSRTRGHIYNHTDAGKELYPRISKPIELMRNSYDYIVIGSGYGGAVAASRLARSVGPDGRGSVCVLERGVEKWPGEYPAGPASGFKNLHVSGEIPRENAAGIPIHEGDPTAMYHLIMGRGINAIVGNGLGGTSLMNANVFLRTDEETLRSSHWPEEIRNDPAVLDKYYEQVERVLEPATYPDDWPELAKVKLFKQQAEVIGMKDKFQLVPQTTRFHNGPNSCGVEMFPSSLTGQDATGLNDGSKTTTLVTYLADAWNWGAEMFCEAEVRYIQECKGPEGGYLVFFSWHGRNRGQFKGQVHGDLMWVHAKKCVFLGAGSIGTTEILLRSKRMGLEMSERVGQGMSGNGDILAFGYNTDYDVNAVGKDHPDPYEPVGPTINSIIDNRRGHADRLDGYVIQEGAIPGALAPFLHAMLEALPGRGQEEGGIFDQFKSGVAKLGGLVLGPFMEKSPLDKTQVYLVMSHDNSQAKLTLEDDRPILDFIGCSRGDHVEKICKILEEATTKMGGKFVQNPFYELMNKEQVTVHPIGGACMANDGTGLTGGTNHQGELFRGGDGATHAGIVVMDGALIPASLGVNPFATITALAERNVDLFAQKHNLTVRDDRNGILDLFGEPEHPFAETRPEPDEVVEQQEIKRVSSTISTAESMRLAGLGFTEVMAGFIHSNDEGVPTCDKKESYREAYNAAKDLDEAARFFLSVQSFDTKSMVKRADHQATLTGTFVCPSLEGSPFMVQRGEFRLLVVDQRASCTRNMTYDFDMRGTDRSLLHFHGYKIVDSSVGLSVKEFWKATSTLYVTISRWPGGVRQSDDAQGWRRGEVVARGMLHIEPGDFKQQLMTLAPTGDTFWKKAWSMGSFVNYFGRTSLTHFLGPLAPLQYPPVAYDGYINDSPPDKSFTIVADDGVKTRMHMWEPTNTEIPARNVLLVPGAGVDHQIYATPTIPYNLVNYLTRAGYRVFVSVHRIGQLIVARNDHTTYDCRLDLRACIDLVRTRYPEPEAANPGNKVYVFAHCMGSVALSAGMLEGDIPAAWVRGVSCSQVFMNPIWDTVNMKKAKAGPVALDKLYKMVAGNWFSIATDTEDKMVQKMVNQLLRFYPDPMKEVCNNASCHRSSFVFGRCWNHRNLNEATHRQIDRFFGGVNMTLMELLMRQGREGHVMNHSFEPLDTPKNIQRLRGVPFFFFVGADNAVLSQAATEKTYSILCQTFGRDGSGGDDDQAGEKPAITEKNPGEDTREPMYRRVVIPGYGHLDGFIGKDAWTDVYPTLRTEIDRVIRGKEYRFVEPRDRFFEMVATGEMLC